MDIGAISYIPNKQNEQKVRQTNSAKTNLWCSHVVWEVLVCVGGPCQELQQFHSNNS